MRVIQSTWAELLRSTSALQFWRRATPILAALAVTTATGFVAADDSTKAQPTIFESIKSALDQGQVTKTQQLGFALTKTAFEECPDQGAMLIGFDVGVGKFLNKDQVFSLRPLYRTADKSDVYFGEHGQFSSPEAPSKKPTKPIATQTVQVKAKPDYAVGAITLRTGLNVHGMCLTFMRVKGTALDPSDAYNSNWIGDSKSGQEKTLNGNGAPIVGVFGNKNEQQVLALGLYFAHPTVVKESPPLPPPSVNPERIPKVPSPQLDHVRQGRTDELQGDPSTPPTQLVDRLKPSSTASDGDPITPTNNAAASDETEDGAGDLILIAVLACVLVAVPVVMLMVVFRNRKKEPPAPRTGLRLQDTNPMDMVLARGRGALPNTSAAISSRPYGNLPATSTPHLPEPSRSVETPTGLARYATTPPNNARLPSALANEDESILPDLPAVGVLPQRNAAVVPQPATCDLPPLPPAAGMPQSRPQWGFSVAGGQVNSHQPDFFHARATCSLGKNRFYRVYILPSELLFIEAGSGDPTQMTTTGAVVGGLVGALIMGAVANNMKKKATAIRQQLDLASTDELLQIATQRQNCFRANVAELTAARLDAAGFWHKLNYGTQKCAALLHCKFQRRGDYTLELQDAEDVQIAIEKLTQILGRSLEVNVVWDGRNKFVRRPKHALAAAQ